MLLAFVMGAQAVVRRVVASVRELHLAAQLGASSGVGPRGAHWALASAIYGLIIDDVIAIVDAAAGAEAARELLGDLERSNTSPSAGSSAPGAEAAAWPA